MSVGGTSTNREEAEESFGVEVSETREKKEVLQRVSRSKDGSGLTVCAFMGAGLGRMTVQVCRGS